MTLSIYKIFVKKITRRMNTSSLRTVQSERAKSEPRLWVSGFNITCSVVLPVFVLYLWLFAA